MLKNELSNKEEVLNELDDLILTLHKMEKLVQVEVNRQLNEEGNKEINKVKRLENELLSLDEVYNGKNNKYDTQIKKGRSFHLTLSY